MLQCVQTRQLHTTRSNRVRLRSKQVYLREEDIGCGSPVCTDCQYFGDRIPLLRDIRATSDGASKKPTTYVFCEESVFLTQLDVLTNPVFLEDHSVVILSSMLLNLRRNKFRDYKKIKARLLTSENHAMVQSGHVQNLPVYVFENTHHHFCATHTGHRKKGESLRSLKTRALMVAVMWYAHHLSAAVDFDYPDYEMNDLLRLVVLFNDEQTVLKVRKSVSEIRKSSDSTDSSSINPEPDDNGDVEMDDHTSQMPQKQKEQGSKLKASKYLCAMRDHVEFVGIHEYIESELPLLKDSLSVVVSSDLDNGQPSNSSGIRFKPHWSLAKLESGLSDGSLLKGKLKVVRAGGNNAFATVRVSSQGGRCYEIRGMSAINRAIHDDTVVIEPNSSSSSSSSSKSNRSARVVGVLEKHWREYCGSIDEEYLLKNTQMKHKKGPRSGGGGSVMFVPLDSRIPKIRIESLTMISELWDKRITVRIDKWDLSSRYPIGHFVQCIGVIGELECETKCLLIEHDIPNKLDNSQWSDAVLDCLPKGVIDGRIDTEAHLKREPYRKDLRSLLVCSVDPPGCQDIDDALSCVDLPNGNLQIGVHIADVAHYIPVGCALDKEASQRSTSVYLVDRRLDMLPSLLSTDLCSLVPNRDRLSFSVIWEFDPEKCEILDTKFMRSVIHSRCKFSYAQAQCRIDQCELGYISNTARTVAGLPRLKEEEQKNAQILSEEIESNKKEVYGLTGDRTLDESLDRSLCSLMRISKQLRKRRFEAGSLELASSQPKFRLDKDNGNKPIQLKPYPHCDANEMIEEFMLLANISVAKQILSKFPSMALLRRHPTPTPIMLEPLVKCAQVILGKDYDFRCDNSLELSQSLKECYEGKINDNNDIDNKNDNDKSDDDLEIVIKMIATRCMTQAIYFVSGDIDANEYLHYGLASPIYTHFTSPIRRYSDMVVHRMLAASIGIDDLPLVYKTDQNLLNNLCDNMNIRHRTAQYIQRASNHLYTLLYFESHGSVIADAIITKLDSMCIDLFIHKYCMQTRIHLAQLGGSSLLKNGSIIMNKKNKSSNQDWLFDAEKMILEKKSPPAFKFKPFQTVKVKIYVFTSKMKRKRLVVDLVDDHVQRSGMITHSDFHTDDIFQDNP